MKRLYTFLMTLIIVTLSFSQVPQKMSYQAIIRDVAGNLVAEKTVGLRISILYGSTDGVTVHTETFNPTTNANGLISIEIGGDVGFNSIDWSDGLFFIKTETDPTGGSNYTITGTSQLLSVPYALHSKSSDVLTGDITESQITDLQNYLLTETDPLFSEWDKTYGIEITESQITDLQDYLTEEDDPLFTTWDRSTGIVITESQIIDLGSYIETETDPSVPAGTQAGEMQYWDGTAWVTVAPGTNGQVLTFSNGMPTWSTTVGQNDVYNPSTGKIWMDRNLGASQVANSSTDAAAYGDLYQWGRAADEHQLRTSLTTSTLSNSDTPEHGNFITTSSSPWDWHSSQNHNLWQGMDGLNNPCPPGYRLPSEAELDAEKQSWSSNHAAGAFNSPLKLPMAGLRDFSSGSHGSVGSAGYYWTGTVANTFSSCLYLDSNSSYMLNSRRAYGFSVRCIKD